MKTKTAVLNGKPDARNPYVRFDEAKRCIGKAGVWGSTLQLGKLLAILSVATSLFCAHAEYVNDWTVGDTTWHLAAPSDWTGGIFDPMSDGWTKPPYPPTAIITGVRTTAAIAEHLIIPQYALWAIHSDPAYHDPNGSSLVTAIRSSAFKDWDALKMVSIPSTVTSIGLPCFSGCSGLTAIKITNGAPTADTEIEIKEDSAFDSSYITKDGVLYVRDVTKLIKYPEGRTNLLFTVSSSVTSLATGCLAGTKLRGVLFEGDCPETTSAAFTGSTCAIYRYSDASGWPEGANVTWCGRPVLSLPRSMMETVSSTNLYGKVTRHEYHYEIFDGMLCKYEKEKRLRDESYEYYGVTLCSVSPVYGEVKLPDVLGGLPVVRIGEAAMKSHNNMTSVEIPSTVEEIGSSAFDTCTRLQMVEFPRKLKAIGSRAFSQCVALTSVVLPEGLESIAYRAFSSCHSLNSIKLPDSLFKVEKEAFIYSENILNTEAMPGLITVDGWIVGPGDDFPGGTLDLHGARGLLPGAFENCETLKRVVMAPEIRIISDNVFYNCTNLESVVFCEGLEQIGEDAFAHTAIREAILPDGCGEIDLDIFRSSRIEYLRVPSSSGIKGTGCGLGGLKTLDYAAREMEEWAFANADSLVNVILRNGVEKICDCAFADCNELKVIVVPPSVTEFDGVAVFEGTGQHVTMYLPTTLRDYIKKNENAYTFCESYTTIFYNPEDFHYVTFDTAGGSMEAPDYITVGGKLWQYPEPRLAKHSFLGWFTEREGGTKVAPSAKITSDMTLYAHWLYDGSAMVNVECGYAFTGGNKLCKAGEKVNLKVMASIVHVTHTDSDGVVTKWDEVFAGWYQDGEPLVSDSDYRSPSLVYVAKGESDVTIEGRYVLLAEDAARLSVANIAAGETFVVNGSWTKKVEIDSYSLPSVSAKGLPAGLKFDAKTLTISGKPTKPGKYDVELSLKNASVKTAKKFTFTIVVPNFESDLIADGIDYASDAYTYVAGTKIAPILPVPAEGVTVKAAGLPSGLKLVGGKNGVPYSIEGTSTAKPGAYTVTLTLTKGKVKETATITINIENRKLDLLLATCDGSLTTGCKVTGGGSYAAGKKVTLKATAAAYKKATAKTLEQVATVFAGWYRDSNCTKPLEGAVDHRTASYSYVTTDRDETIYAKFVPAADDGTIALAVNGNEVVDDSGAVRVVVKDAATLPPVEIGSVSIPKASVKGLPAGLKWDAKKNCFTGAPTKPGVYKVTFSLTNTTVKKAIVRAFTIEVPNFESPAFPGLKAASDAYPVSVGVAALPAVDAGLASAYAGYTVKVTGLPSGLSWKGGVLTGLAKKAGDYTVTFTATKGKDKQAATITIHVEALPDWTVGTFVGMVRQVDRDERGEVVEDEDGLHDWYDILTTVSVTSAGKVSGKLHFESGTDVSFKSDSIAERIDSGYVVRGQLKDWGIAADVELLVRKVGTEMKGFGDLGAVDVLLKQTGRQEGKNWIACNETTFSTDAEAPLRQNIWSSKKLSLPPNVNGVKETIAVGEDVYTLTFGKNGSVKVSLAKADKPTKAIASGSATLSIVGYDSNMWSCELCTSVVVKKNDYGEVCIFDVTILADGTVTCVPQR